MALSIRCVAAWRDLPLRRSLPLSANDANGLDAALGIHPDFAIACSNLGNVLEQQGRLEEAVASYRRALEIQPDYREAAGSLGSVLLSLGKLEEGLAMEQKGFGVVSFDLENGVSIQ